MSENKLYDKQGASYEPGNPAVTEFSAGIVQSDSETRRRRNGIDRLAVIQYIGWQRGYAQHEFAVSADL
jgi:hypothetical protein